MGAGGHPSGYPAGLLGSRATILQCASPDPMCQISDAAQCVWLWIPRGADGQVVPSLHVITRNYFYSRMGPGSTGLLASGFRVYRVYVFCS